MKYEGVQTTNKTMRVYNFAHWDGCWCLYIEWSTSIYISKNLIIKILKKVQLVKNYHNFYKLHVCMYACMYACMHVCMHECMNV